MVGSPIVHNASTSEVADIYVIHGSIMAICGLSDVGMTNVILDYEFVSPLKYKMVAKLTTSRAPLIQSRAL